MTWILGGILVILVVIASERVWNKQRRQYKLKRRHRREGYVWQSLQKFQTEPSPLENSDIPIALKSEVNADFRRLQQFLDAQMFREADLETYHLVLQIAGREQKGWVRNTDLQDMPSTDLLTIDRLWTNYSEGRFGFSVQRKLYRSLGGTREYNEAIWQNFGDRVGWRLNGTWISYAQINFRTDAPPGHLPAAGGVWVGVVPRVVGWGHGRYLLCRDDLER